jgi:hypothetical protein
LKHLACSLIFVYLLGIGVTPARSLPQTLGLQATKAEEKEGRELALQFTLEFTKTQDLTSVIRNYYFSDFAERYKNFKLHDLSSKPVDLYFAPGLDYSSPLLATADSEDWERFYVAANNFLILGFISALKRQSDETPNLKPTDLYPPEVIELLHKNSALAHMILRNGPGNPVRTIAEMRAATETLAQAVTMIRAKQTGGPPVIKDKTELTIIIMNDDFFKPRVEVLRESFFNFPKGTRILLINTPLGLQLISAANTDGLRVFWTEIITE